MVQSVGVGLVAGCWRGSPRHILSRSNLAGAYRNAGRLEEALPLHERTLAARERLLGPVHPQVAVALYRLGQTQAALGDLAAAATALGRAAEFDAAAYGPDHPEVATDLDALAAEQDRQDNTAGAAATRARAQRIREQHLPGSTGAAGV